MKVEVHAVSSEGEETVVRFVEGDELRLTPAFRRDRIVGIRQVDWRKDRDVLASVSSEGPTGNLEGLRERVGATIDFERRIYREYRAGRIVEREWAEKYRAFWRVSIKLRTVLQSLSS